MGDALNGGMKKDGKDLDTRTGSDRAGPQRGCVQDACLLSRSPSRHAICSVAPWAYQRSQEDEERRHSCIYLHLKRRWLG